MGWLIALAVLVGIGCIPVGAFVRYDSQGLVVKVVAGWLRLTLIPTPKWMKKKKKPQQNPPVQPEAESEPSPPPKAKEQRKQKKEEPEEPKGEKGGSLTDFLPLVRVALDAVNQFRRKLRLDELVLVLTLAGDDPCDLALNYGRAWEALGNLMPRLERVFTIGKRRMEVQCDFTSQETRIEAQVRLTITIGRLLRLILVYAYLFVKEYLKFKKKRKGGTES